MYRDAERRIAIVLCIALAMLMSTTVLVPPASSQPLVLYVIWFLGFNTTLPPFDNLMARQAVASGIDRAKLAATDNNNLATGIEPPGCMANNPRARHHLYNPDRAKELLAQSGLNLEELGDLGLWYLSGLRRAASRKELDMLVADISAIGLRPTLREFGNYNAYAKIATLPVVKMSYWGVLSASPFCANDTAFLEDLVHSKGEFNYFGYRNPDVDSLIDRAKRTNDRAAKIALFQEAEQKVIDEAVLVPVWWYSIR